MRDAYLKVISSIKIVAVISRSGITDQLIVHFLELIE